MYWFHHDFENFWRALDNLSGGGRRIDLLHPTQNRAWPRVDLFVKDDRAVVRATVPGLSSEDVSVEVAGNLVTLTCARAAEGGAGEERTRDTRKLRLPFRADPERAEASLRRGVFELRLERLQSDKPLQITVTTD